MDNIWVRHESLIKNLYQNEGKTLKQVKKILESEYGFPETILSQYETQLRDTLGLRKKLKAEQWPKVYNYARSQGYQSFDLYLSGNMTPWVKAWKEIRRSGAHKLPLDSDQRHELPPGVTIQAVSMSARRNPRSTAARQTRSRAVMPPTISTRVAASRHIPRNLAPNQHYSQLVQRNSLTSPSAYADEATPTALIPVHSIVWRSNYAKSLLDILPWHEYRFELYSLLISGKPASPRFEESGDICFALMPVDRFSTHIPGRLMARVSDSSYPSPDDLPYPRESISALASNFDVYHFLATMVYLVSNNLVSNHLISDVRHLDDIIEMLYSGVSRNIVKAFFSKNLLSIRAVWDALFQVLREDSMYRKHRWHDNAAAYLVDIIFRAQPEWIENDKNRVLWEMVRRGHAELVRRLLGIGALPGYHDNADDGGSIIATAASSNYECARLLIEHLDTNATWYSRRCGHKAGTYTWCKVLHSDSQVPVSHFFLFLDFAIARRTWPIGDHQDVLDMLLDAGADVDSTIFSSFTLGAYRHGEIESIPWEWMPTCLDMCFYWNRPLFHYLRPYSVRMNESLTRAGVCEAALKGKHMLAAYLETASAHSVQEKMQFLEIVLIEHFHPSSHTLYEPQLRMNVVRNLIKFGVLKEPTILANLRNVHKPITRNPAGDPTQLMARLIRSAEQYGCDEDNIFVMRYLYQHWNSDKYEILCWAVQTADASILKALSPVLANDLVEFGASVLVCAACINNYEGVSWLLDNGVDINAQVVNTRNEHLTILGCVWGGDMPHGLLSRPLKYISMSRFLVSKGAKLRRHPSDLNCCLLLKNDIQKYSSLETYHMISEHPADLEQIASAQWQDLTLDCARYIELDGWLAEEENSGLALFETLYQKLSSLPLGPLLAGYIGGGGKDSVIQELIARGASIHDYTHYYTPLQAAASQCNLRLVTQLLDLGADINAPSKRGGGATALQAICRWKPSSTTKSHQKTAMITFLLNKGAHVDGDGYPWQNTPLHICAELGDIVNASLLAQHGANPNVGYFRKDMSICPLDSAAKNGRLDMTRYLLRLGAFSGFPGETGYDGAIQAAVSGLAVFDDDSYKIRRPKHLAVAKLIESHIEELAKKFEQKPEMFMRRAAAIEQHKINLARVQERSQQWEKADLS